jgi:hypothetical protein
MMPPEEPMARRVLRRRLGNLAAALTVLASAGCITPSPESDFCRQGLIEVCANNCQGICIRERRSLPVASPSNSDVRELALTSSSNGATAVAY